MKVTPQLVDAMLRAGPGERYEFFVKKVADWEVAWGLYADGWATLKDEDGNEVFPLWPAAEFAVLCATGEWVQNQPKEIDLTELLEVVLPELEGDRASVGVFYVPAGEGIVVAPGRLKTDLEEEGTKYE